MSCENCIGFCKRRQTEMVDRHVELCSIKRKYADAFDNLYGVADESVVPSSYESGPPVIPPPKPMRQDKTPKAIIKHAEKAQRRGLGDLVEGALSSVGITDERVQKWIGRPCGCKGRKEKLNKLSDWARQVFESKTPDKLLPKLEELMQSNSETADE